MPVIVAIALMEFHTVVMVEHLIKEEMEDKLSIIVPLPMAVEEAAVATHKAVVLEVDVIAIQAAEAVAPEATTILASPIPVTPMITNPVMARSRSLFLINKQQKKETSLCERFPFSGNTRCRHSELRNVNINCGIKTL